MTHVNILIVRIPERREEEKEKQRLTEKIMTDFPKFDEMFNT